MNRWRYVVALLIVQIFQHTVLSQVAFFGVSINLILIYTICLSILYGEYWGAYTGLGLGLMEDIIFSNILGIRALLYYFVGVFVGRAMRNTSSNKATGALTVVLSTLFVGGAEIAIYLALRHPITTWWYLKGPIVISAMLNGLCYFVVLPMVKWGLKPQTVKKYSGY